MNIDDLHNLLHAEFGAEAIVGVVTDKIDPWIVVAPHAIVEVATFLRDDARTRFDHLNDLCGVDYFEPDEKKAAKFDHEPHVAVVYHLQSYELKHRLVVKVELPRWRNDVPGELPECPSVSGVWAIADWHERECYDLMGVRFTNHPNLRRILCPEDWVGHPLRKDYEMPLEYHGIRGK
jgi:NADH-quinone oxidoreductase subunit C